jgi:hypothetical protein
MNHRSWHHRTLPWVVASLSILPTWVPADTLITAMNAVTVRVLCRSANGLEGAGSGFTLDSGTHIATNWHVVSCVDQGGKVSVLLAAEPPQLVEAKVREHDPVKDLAVLKLDRPVPRPDARFGTFSTLEQRDPVIAVGFPGGADEQGDARALSAATLTEGVIGRLLPRGDGAGPPLVQISAAINPGNSGGPLFDETGRVVGINTLKSLALVPTVTEAGTIGVERVVLGEGLGWAVATDALLPLLDRLGLAYEVSQRRLSPLERWWQREPVLIAGLGLLLLAILGLTVLLVTATGRARVRESLTRLGSRGHLTTAPSAPQRQAPMASRLPVLLGVAGPYAGQTIPLPAGVVAIGRDPALAQLVIPADQVGISQRHALVGHDPDKGGFYVEDCWSTNGVFLLTGQGKVIRAPAGQAQPLAPGARFYLATPAVSFEVNYQ